MENYTDFYTDYKYKKRTGELSDGVAFLIGFLGTIISYIMVLIPYLIDGGTKTIKSSKAILKEYPITIKLLLVFPLVMGLITILMNRIQKSMTKSRMKLYKKQGFTEKEALEQTLADTREGGNTHNSVNIPTFDSANLRRRR